MVSKLPKPVAAARVAEAKVRKTRAVAAARPVAAAMPAKAKLRKTARWPRRGRRIFRQIFWPATRDEYSAEARQMMTEAGRFETLSQDPPGNGRTDKNVDPGRRTSRRTGSSSPVKARQLMHGEVMRTMIDEARTICKPTGLYRARRGS
jgi:hypothetical protein